MSSRSRSSSSSSSNTNNSSSNSKTSRYNNSQEGIRQLLKLRTRYKASVVKMMEFRLMQARKSRSKKLSSKTTALRMCLLWPNKFSNVYPMTYKATILTYWVVGIKAIPLIVHSIS